MKAAVFTLVLALVVAIFGRAQDEAPAPFAWLDSLDDARAKAALEGKPVLALFRCVP